MDPRKDKRKVCQDHTEIQLTHSYFRMSKRLVAVRSQAEKAGGLPICRMKTVSHQPTNAPFLTDRKLTLQKKDKRTEKQRRTPIAATNYSQYRQCHIMEEYITA